MKTFLLLLLAASIPANDAPPVTYALKSLHPQTLALYQAVGGTRHHLRFQNDQGVHSLVFEGNEAPTVVSMLQSTAGWNSVCSMELECGVKAYCTGDCRGMYYEIANGSAEDAKKCKIRAFTCGATETSLTAHTPAPATIAPATMPALAASAPSPATAAAAPAPSAPAPGHP